MASMKKGRAVTAAERPVYEHCTRLFLAGRIHGFWAYERNDWAVQSQAGAPVFDRSFNEMKDLLRRIDPDGCTWDTQRPVKRTGKADLLDLSKRLLAALTDGSCDEILVTDARRLIGAA